MTFLRNVQINLTSTFNKHKIFQKEIERLAGLQNPQAQRLKEAIEKTLNLPLTPEEKFEMDQIERLRCKLNTNLQTVGTASQISSPLQNLTMAQTSLSSKSKLWAFLLYNLIRTFQPRSCLELGTNVGISAAYQGLALEFNGKGKLVTVEGDPGRAACACKHWEKLNIANIHVVVGKFQEILVEVAERHAPIDYAFIDGHHDRDATLRYFDILLPHLAKQAVVIFDDINWSPGMQEAWAKIQTNQRVQLFSDLYVLGICLT